MKYAVGAKKATLDFIRDKELILAEFESNDFLSLRERFRSYILLMDKYPRLKKIVFDASLFKVIFAAKAWGKASDEISKEIETEQLLLMLEEDIYEGL